MMKPSWWAIPFIDYLNAVDDALEAKIGSTSTQEELATIASAHENDVVPSETAEMIALDRHKETG